VGLNAWQYTPAKRMPGLPEIPFRKTAKQVEKWDFYASGTVLVWDASIRQV
jgi:hypothetical protein